MRTKTVDLRVIHRKIGRLDYDKDGVPDRFDCVPYDPKQDGLFGDLFKHVVGQVSSAYRGAQAHAQVAASSMMDAIGLPTYQRYGGSYRPSNRTARRISGGSSSTSASSQQHTTPPPPPRPRANVSGKASAPKKTVSAAPKKSIFEQIPAIAAAISTTGSRVREMPIRDIWDIKPVIERAARPATATLGSMIAPHYKAAQQAVGLCPATEEWVEVSQAEGELKTAKLRTFTAGVAFDRQYGDKGALPPAEYDQAVIKAAEFDTLAAAETAAYTTYSSKYDAAIKAHGTPILDAPKITGDILGAYGITGRIGVAGANLAKQIETAKLPFEQRLASTPVYLGAPMMLLGIDTTVGDVTSFGKKRLANIASFGSSIPMGVEVIGREVWKRPEIVPAALVVGMGGIAKAAYNDPVGTAGDIVLMGKTIKATKTITAPITPKIIRTPGYTGIGIRGRATPTYKTVTVKATPKEFLAYEQGAGRIGRIHHKPFTGGKPSPLGTARIDIGEHAAITKPTQIYLSPKTYGYSAMRKATAPLMRLTKPDIYQQRAFRAKYPTRQEVMAHELIHHKHPSFTEGKVQRMTREFGEIPSKKIFDITKRVKTGYARQPVPLIGIRTKSGIPTPKGTEATYRGLTIGSRWTPVEYFKATEATSTPTPAGVLMVTRRASQLRAGKLRYEHQATAKGVVEGGYFLRETPTAPLKPPIREIATGERGLIRVDPVKYPLSTKVTQTKPVKPTRFYGEIRKPYTKFGDVGLSGSKARMKWMEFGERKVTYGIKGSARQPKVEITAQGFTYRPTFPPAHNLRAGRQAAQPRAITGQAPKQIAPDMYFTKTPASSLFYDPMHAAKPKPATKTGAGYRQARREMADDIRADARRAMADTEVMRRAGVMHRQPGQAQPPTPQPQALPKPKPRQVKYAEPKTFTIPSTTPRRGPREVSPAPQMQRAPSPKPKPRQVKYAEPKTATKTVTEILAEVHTKPVRKPTPTRQRTATEIPAQTRIPTPTPAKEDQRKRSGYVTPVITPIITPAKEDQRKRSGYVTPVITPIITPAKKDQRKRDPFIIPITTTDTSGAGLYPIITPYTVTEPKKDDKTIVPYPGGHQPPPNPPIKTPTPKPPESIKPFILPKPKTKAKDRKPKKSRYGEQHWQILNPIPGFGQMMFGRVMK